MGSCCIHISCHILQSGTVFLFNETLQLRGPVFAEHRLVTGSPLSSIYSSRYHCHIVHVARAPRIAATSSSFSTKLLASIFSPTQTCGH
jgi:hypothetical protein